MIWVLLGNEFLILKQSFVKDVKNVVLRQFARWELPKYRIRNYILMKMSVFTVVDVWETADSIRLQMDSTASRFTSAGAGASRWPEEEP